MVGRRRVVTAVAVLALLAGGWVAFVRLGPPSDSTCTVGTSGTVGPASSGSGTSTPYTISATQAREASIIAAVAVQMGLPDHAVTVALATSLQETKLRNLPYGDQDSVGLFQQRPSQGWGTTAQILDPVYAATVFYQHLVKVSGWESLAITDAAQMVQHSADPEAYAQWADEARALAIALTGEVPAGLACTLHGYSGGPPQAGALAAAESSELGSPGFGVAVDAKRGWELAMWAVAHAYHYHLSSVSFAGQTWTPSGSWKATSSSGPAGAVTISP